MRVLHVLGGLNRGGAETFVLNLYRAIDRDKIQFDFIIHTDKRQDYSEEIESLGGKIYVFPKFNGKNYFKVKKCWNEFFACHTEYKVLHSHVRSYASIYIPIAKKHGLKTIIHSHSTNDGGGISGAIKRLMEFPLRYQADYLFACSHEAGEWLYGKKACRKSNFYFIPNAIDTDKYEFNEQVREEYRSEFALQGKFVIGHVGRFSKPKNHTFLIDVFNLVCKERNDAVLLLVGDGELKERITEKVVRLGLQDRVIFTGSRGDVANLLQAMDVFVFPSLWEGLPVPVVEAQASGLPCIISDVITTDVDVSDLIERVTEYKPENWSEKINSCRIERKNVIKEIKSACFDVNDSAKNLSDFYTSVGGGDV